MEGQAQAPPPDTRVGPEGRCRGLWPARAPVWAQGFPLQRNRPPRFPPPAELTAPPAAAGSPVGPCATFAIKGMKIEAQAKAKPTRPSRAHPAKPKGCQQHPKIRNYNFKD